MIQDCYDVRQNIPVAATLTTERVGSVVCEEGKGKLDLLILKYMVRRLNMIIRQLEQPTTTTGPLLYMLPERHQRTHRVLLYRHQELLSGTPLLFVGFISRKQKGLAPTIIEDIQVTDRQMVEELASNPALLSYSSLELRNGDWCNLVIMHDGSAKAHIRNSKLHSYAAHNLARNYYDWIRLHNGIMHQGLDHTEMCLQKTKYYTFDMAQASRK